MADKLKWLLVVLLVGGGIYGFYHYDQHSLLLRVLALLAVGAVAVGIALTTEAGRRAVAFFQEAQLEVRKVVWPTGRETVQTTLVVMAMVTVLAVFLWMVDALLLWTLKTLTGQGG